MLNHIVLMGRLTRDPELRHTQSQIPVASFSLAVERDFGTQQDGSKLVDFIDITAWRNTAEFVSKYFSKGRMAVVSGRLQMRDWTDKDGNKRTSAEVVADNVYFGDSKRDNASGGQSAAAGTGSYQQPTPSNGSYPPVPPAGTIRYPGIGSGYNYSDRSYSQPPDQTSFAAPPAFDDDDSELLF